MTRDRAPQMIHRAPAGRGRERGLSLVELMVAMLISLILIAGVAQIFISNKGTYAMDEALARLQENGRMAFNLIGRDVRQAGLSGCNVDQVDTFLDNPSEEFFDPSNAITGYEYGGTGPGDTYALPSSFPEPDTNAGSWTSTNGDDLPADLVDDGAVPGSDVIVLQRASTLDNVVLSNKVQPGTAQLQVNGTTGVEQGQILMISDCTQADVFQNTNNQSAGTLNRGSGGGGFPPGNINPSSNDWNNGQGWDTDASVLTLDIRAFFVGRDSLGRPALKVANFGQGTAQFATLVSGVESFQVLYGVDSNMQRGVDQYMTAAQINGSATVQPRDILSVQMHLLMRSSEDVPGEPDTESYRLGATGTNVGGTSVTIDPHDERRLRQVFSTTFAVRNRLVAQK